MAELLDQDELLSLGDAAHRCPGHVSQSAVWRWARVGLNSRNGNRIRLRHCRVGGRLYTSYAWLHNFFEALAEADAEYFARTAPSNEAPSPAQRRSSRQREKDIAAADARLAARGA